MKQTILSLTLSLLSMGIVIAQETFERTGTYHSSEVKQCAPCSTPAQLKYTGVNKENVSLNICFDREPGAFYEIFEGEKITVTGAWEKIPCDDGHFQHVLYVSETKMEPLSRKEVVPAFLKKEKRTAPADETPTKGGSPRKG